MMDLDDILNYIREQTNNYTTGPIFSDKIATEMGRYDGMLSSWRSRGSNIESKFKQISREDCLILNTYKGLSGYEKQKCSILQHIRIVYDEELLNKIPGAEKIYTGIDVSCTGNIISNTKTVLFMKNLSPKVAQKIAGPGIDIRCYPQLNIKNKDIQNIALAAGLHAIESEGFEKVYIYGVNASNLSIEEQIVVNEHEEIVLI